MAYLPAHILDAFGWEWRERQSGAGTHAACESLEDAGPLHTQARLVAKRQAQKRVVECLFAESLEPLPPVIHGSQDLALIE